MEYFQDKKLDNLNEDYVKKLIDDGVDVNIRNEYGETPLEMATAQRHVNICKMLINAKADMYTKNMPELMSFVKEFAKTTFAEILEMYYKN